MTNDSTTIPISLVIAGGASLGCWEAGVMYELTRQLAYHNQRAANGDSENYRYEIDVITGASAGSMTGALTARLLADNHDFYNDRWKDSPFYKAWVRDADIANLRWKQGAIKAKQKHPAIFDMSRLDHLTKKYVVEGSTSNPSTDPKTSITKLDGDGKAEVSLGFMLTSMEGYTYSSGAMITTSHDNMCAGQLVHDRANQTTSFQQLIIDDDQIHPGKTIHNTDAWKHIAEYAISSGRFPVAFQPSLQRWQPNAGQTRMNDIFMDGGMLNNEPLLPAIRLARGIDGGILNPKRVFILIDPFENSANIWSEKDPFIKNLMCGHGDYGMAEIGRPISGNVKRLISIATGQLRHKPWVQEHEKTKRKTKEGTQAAYDLINLYHSLKTQDIKLTKQDALTPHQYVDLLNRLEELLNIEQRINFPSDEAMAELHSLKKNLLKENPDVTLFKYLADVFYRHTELPKRDVNLINISVKETETMSRDLAGFGGVLYENFRRHDYLLGAEYARKKLKPSREPSRANLVEALLHKEVATIEDKCDFKVDGSNERAAVKARFKHIPKKKKRRITQHAQATGLAIASDLLPNKITILIARPILSLVINRQISRYFGWSIRALMSNLINGLILLSPFITIAILSILLAVK